VTKKLEELKKMKGLTQRHDGRCSEKVHKTLHQEEAWFANVHENIRL
jgi:hypothetical protein